MDRASSMWVGLASDSHWGEHIYAIPITETDTVKMADVHRIIRKHFPDGYFLPSETFAHIHDKLTQIFVECELLDRYRTHMCEEIITTLFL